MDTWITQRREQKMITDSGATSHFISEEMNLPKGNKSNKEVYLPDNTTLRTSTKTKLPFIQLTETAREIDVLPGLKWSLISVKKMSEEGKKELEKVSKNLHKIADKALELSRTSI